MVLCLRMSTGITLTSSTNTKLNIFKEDIVKSFEDAGYTNITVNVDYDINWLAIG
jgi:hypothetical protein